MNNVEAVEGMYEELDKRIIEAIKQGRNPLYEEFRVIDGRLQQLRKSKKIRHCTKNVTASPVGRW